MKYIFSCMGGSASTYFIKTLSKRYDVGNKPDTVFRSIIDELKIGEVNSNQGTFYERSNGYEIDSTQDFSDVIANYISYLNASTERTAVFNTCAELGLFSTLSVENVIFFVRHPLHSYVSWAKPIRHGDVINYLGGVSSPQAVLFWATRWNKFTDELFRLQSKNILGGIIRFEYAHSDVEKIQEFKWVFNDFDNSKRNNNVLDKKCEDILKDKVMGNYLKLYSDWQI